MATLGTDAEEREKSADRPVDGSELWIAERHEPWRWPGREGQDAAAGVEDPDPEDPEPEDPEDLSDDFEDLSDEDDDESLLDEPESDEDDDLESDDEDESLLALSDAVDPARLSVR